MANRKVDASGRSKLEGRYIQFFYWQLNTPAFRSLSPNAKAVLLELKRRYNGSNNGQIHLSHREAALVLHVAVNTAKKAFKELQDKGFIRIAQMGSFSRKVRHATTWILTEHGYGTHLATKDFMRLSVDDLAKIDGRKFKTRYHQLIPTVSPIDTETQS